MISVMWPRFGDEAGRSLCRGEAVALVKVRDRLVLVDESVLFC